MTEKQIQLTEEATKRLDAAVEAYRNGLIESLEENRFVPGEKVIEITASDVERAVDDVRYGSRRRLERRKFYSQMFLAMGVTCLLFGLMYPLFREAFNNPPQLIALAAGLYFTFGGIFFHRVATLYSRTTTPSSEQSIQDRISRLERLLEEASSKHKKPPTEC
jgi:hypothetical protein